MVSNSRLGDVVPRAMSDSSCGAAYGARCCFPLADPRCTQACDWEAGHAGVCACWVHIVDAYADPVVLLQGASGGQGSLSAAPPPAAAGAQEGRAPPPHACQEAS